jgi:hypothetical protein
VLQVHLLEASLDESITDEGASFGSTIKGRRMKLEEAKACLQEFVRQDDRRKRHYYPSNSK